MKPLNPPTTSVLHPPAPAVTVHAITDPMAVSEDLDVLEQDAVKLERSPLRARRIAVRLGSSVLLFQTTNLAIRTRTTLQGEMTAFVAFGPSATGTLNGRSIRPDRIVAGSPGVRVEFVVGAGYESVSVLVAPEDLRALVPSRWRVDRAPAAPDIELLQSTAGSRLFDCGKQIACAAAARPELFEDVYAKAGAKAELFKVLDSTLRSAVAAEPETRDATRRAYSRVVQTAEDYALKHPAEPLYMINLCKAASVSERTLQNAFKEIMGMTPVAFLTRLRLHRVRRALRAANDHSTTVSAEARKWGFWHLGEFPRAYRDCFGELPSDTLKGRHRAGGDNPP
jgi:AraC-like DNA-binding protein